MRLFVTHMQDFTPLEWPIISFSRQAVVERLCRNIGNKEYLLYVASQKCPRSEVRGKILGFAKIKDQVVRTAAQRYVNPEKVDDGCMKNGHFKWPFGVLIGEAKLVINPADAKFMIGPQFSRAPQGDFYVLTDPERVGAIAELTCMKVNMDEAYRRPQ